MNACKECEEYARSMYARGQITRDEISKVATDRHAIKFCPAKGDVFLHWMNETVSRQISHMYNTDWEDGYLKGLIDARKKYLDLLEY